MNRCADKAEVARDVEFAPDVGERHAESMAERLRRIYRHVLDLHDPDGRSSSVARLTRRLIDFYTTGSCDDPRIARALELDYLRYLEWMINTRVTERLPRGVVLHSAGGDCGGGAVLLAGKSGAGKSTLIARLILEGMDFLSDELIVLEHDSARAIPFPKAITLKENSRRLIGDAAPCERSEVYQTACYFDPEQLRRDSTVRGARPIASVVFPAYGAEQKNELRTLTRGETALALFANACNTKTLDAGRSDLLSEIAARCPGYKLTYHDKDFASMSVLEIATGAAVTN